VEVKQSESRGCPRLGQQNRRKTKTGGGGVPTHHPKGANSLCEEQTNKHASKHHRYLIARPFRAQQLGGEDIITRRFAFPPHPACILSHRSCARLVTPRPSSHPRPACQAPDWQLMLADAVQYSGINNAPPPQTRLTIPDSATQSRPTPTRGQGGQDVVGHKQTHCHSMPPATVYIKTWH
jgi:hypothetical protein